MSYKEHQEILQRLVARLRERMQQPVEPIVRFLQQYFANVASEELAERSLDDLYGAVLSHWNLGRRRAPGTTLIRLYNPNLDEHGWRAPYTVIEIVTDDMPFLVDSLAMELARQHQTLHLVIHPVLWVVRDAQGELREVLPVHDRSPEAISEAVMHFEIDRETDVAKLSEVRARLLQVLGDVRVVVEDWHPMRAKVNEIITTLEGQEFPIANEDKSETLAFLRWMEAHHFTFIGFRAYQLGQENGRPILRQIPNSGLGIFRSSRSSHVSRSFLSIPDELREQTWAQSLVMIAKSIARSTVHRPAYLDYVAIKRFDDSGRVIGEWRFLGLYSSLAYSARPVEIPLIRRKVQYVLERSALLPNSHAGKKLQHVLDTFPRDEMFQMSRDELYAMAMGIMQLQERHRLRLFIRRDVYNRFVTALVFIPRDKYTTQLRLRMQRVLIEELNAQSSEFDVLFTESVLARVHFTIRLRVDSPRHVDISLVERKLIEATTSWNDQLANELQDLYGDEQGAHWYQRYRVGLPAAYREDFSPRTAAADVAYLESLRDDQPLATHLYRPLEASLTTMRFKVFGRATPMALSDVMPVLEHMGFHVETAKPYPIAIDQQTRCWILDFELNLGEGFRGELAEVKAIFQEAFLQVIHGAMEDDALNHLVLAAALPWRDVTMLRALCHYTLQTQLPFSKAYMARSLVGHPNIARLLVQLFHGRFDPAYQGDRQELATKLAQRVESALEQVPGLDEDRILRQLLNLLQALLRTNYFQVDSQQRLKNYLSFKLDAQRVPQLPKPLPMAEIYVYSTHVEGVHLRGGRVARGGIRWSDRAEDFRTEVLGLMKAQMVKNAVIVPVGAKGGFVIKESASAKDPKLIQERVQQGYATFIRGLLDLTDNLVQDQVMVPPATVRYDGDDPYLVVAADKGTATFSDLANELAAQYQFWLGDAFASGGSHGYDHKKMGITARGAWESLRRHFRELGRDPQVTPFTAIGIGDMSGDVFGNGLLQSNKIRLVAAFSHRHIFIDPDPDPQASFRERKRLFGLPRSSWDDYDRQILSPGGGVYARSAKAIRLSDSARQALGVEAEQLNPNQLIQAILRTPVDLLWNGGIGTFVKSSAERHADVGDRSNDGIRVNASELRCRVTVEGGNLGFTQLARIEFARHGGHINTDAIDNSGGVDCSDHEVNIKILLDQVVKEGELTCKQRNRLLVEMTEEIAQRVLRNNYLQTQALSMMTGVTGDLFNQSVRLLQQLEREQRLDRALEGLPSDDELTERPRAGLGLFRPELAVLLSYSKVRMFEQLMSSDLVEDDCLKMELADYFPAALGERFREYMDKHPLRREIIATHLTNRILNRMGSTFVLRIQEETGADVADVARCYIAAREIFRVTDLWTAVENLDEKLIAHLQSSLLLEIREFLGRATLWLLHNRSMPLDVATIIAKLRPAVDRFREGLPQAFPQEASTEIKVRSRPWTEGSVPVPLAEEVSGLEPLYSALDISHITEHSESPITEVTEAYFALAKTLNWYWLRGCIAELPDKEYWEAKARAVLMDELYLQLRRLTLELLQTTEPHLGLEDRITQWIDKRSTALRRYQDLVVDLQNQEQRGLAMLWVAVHQMQSVLTSQ